MTLEKPLVGRFRLPRVRPGGKAPNRELPPKSGDITCMQKTSFLGEMLKTAMLMNKNITFCACKYENILNNTLHLK